MSNIHPISSFHVIEDFLNEEEIARFYENVVKDSEVDPKPNFRWTPLGGDDVLKGERNMPWDPDGKIAQYVERGRQFFVENYEMSGQFEPNRVHGNIMLEESFFHSHTDEDPNDEGGYDGAKRTYVCGLFLNDDYEGGEFTFEDQGVSFVPKAGSLVFFPGWCTRHGIEKVTKGSRVNMLAIYHDILP
jgi:hypothetical protein